MLIELTCMDTGEVYRVWTFQRCFIPQSRAAVCIVFHLCDKQIAVFVGNN